MIIPDRAAGRNLSKETRDTFDRALVDGPALALLARLADFLKSHSVRAYLVGGFVRDALLGRDTADIDIAVDTDVLKIAPQLADSLQGKFVLLDEVNRIGRIIIKDWTIDIASFTGTIEDDLARRDFTINAMAVDLNRLTAAGDSQDTRLIDPFGGRLDLDMGIIRDKRQIIIRDKGKVFHLPVDQSRQEGKQKTDP